MEGARSGNGRLARRPLVVDAVRRHEEEPRLRACAQPDRPHPALHRDAAVQPLHGRPAARWALALAPDGRTLFAANPAVGRIAEIHLPTAKLIYQARFSPRPGAFETRAAVAPDGGRFVFTNGEAVGRTTRIEARPSGCTRTAARSPTSGSALTVASCFSPVWEPRRSLWSSRERRQERLRSPLRSPRRPRRCRGWR